MWKIVMHPTCVSNTAHRRDHKAAMIYTARFHVFKSHVNTIWASWLGLGFLIEGVVHESPYVILVDLRMDNTGKRTPYSELPLKSLSRQQLYLKLIDFSTYLEMLCVAGSSLICSISWKFIRLCKQVRGQSIKIWGRSTRDAGSDGTSRIYHQVPSWAYLILYRAVIRETYAMHKIN